MSSEVLRSLPAVWHRRNITLDSPRDKLPNLAGTPICAPAAKDVLLQHLGGWGPVGASLAELLGRKNGFYAFDAALLVRPLSHQSAPLGIVEWNESTLWKSEFVDDLSGVLFFAEDLFGNQFGICGQQVCYLESETGDVEKRYRSLDDWIDCVLGDTAVTGCSLAQTWNQKARPLKPGQRLVAKMPFVCGEFVIDNLYPIDDVTGMNFRASIANQIRDLPDGAEIVFDLKQNGNAS